MARCRAARTACRRVEEICTLLPVLVRADIGGVVVYRSTRLLHIGVCHAFSTRLGGFSPAPFDSMNLGNPNGCAIQDDGGRIAENYRKLIAAIGGQGREVLRVHQVHGAGVVRAERGRIFDVGQKADAIVSNDPLRFVSVRIADCVPVLLASDDGAQVAAIHAGWRGVIAQVALAAVREMGCGGRRITAAIGPCISGEAFEVGAEVLGAFENSFGAAAPMRRRADGKGHVDLPEAIRRQLIAAGVEADRIDMTDRCTFRDGDEFFSHRRDHGVTGRMAALIAAAK